MTTTSKHLRMADVFDLPLSADCSGVGLAWLVDVADRNGAIYEMHHSDVAPVVVHAVNCYDDLLAALLAANHALFDAAEERGFDPPIPSDLELMINDALVRAMGADALREHVERQRARVHVEG